MKKIDINCDMAEGVGNEALLMPYITSANISCGYHAGDEAIIKDVVQLCKQYKVNIGAHPSFADKENFGRRPMQLPLNEIYNIVKKQIEILITIVKEESAIMNHVKPHGALYNMASENEEIATAIAQAVKDVDGNLIVYGLSGSAMIAAANKLGLATYHEVFADRAYQANGILVPRTNAHALLTNENYMIKQVENFILHNKVISISGETIFIKADTICLHGDGEHAVPFAKTIYKKIYEH